MNGKRAALFLGTLSLAAVFESAGQSLNLSPKNVNHTYNSQAETVVTVGTTAKMPNSYPVLDYYLTVDPPTADRVFTSTLYSDTIPYQVFDAASAPRDVIMSETEAVSVSDVLAGTFSDANKQRRASNDVYFVALPGGFATAGTYKATTTVNLWSGPFGSGTLVASADISATLTVAAILDLAVVPLGAPFDYSATSAVFDFGVLEPGDEYQADLIARANTTYGVTVSSQNGGLLRNTDVSDSSTVPYAFFYDSVELPLPAGTAVPIVGGAARTDQEGRRFRLTARVLDFDFPSDGVYTDTLTVSIVQN